MFCCFLVGVHDGQTFERAGRTMVLFDNERSMREFIDNIRTLNITYTNDLRDTLVTRLRAAGIDVNTNIVDGQRMLDKNRFGDMQGLREQMDGDISFTLTDAVNEHRKHSNNRHFINDRNELSADEKETQQKTWRAVYQSLSEISSSDVPRRTEVPGTLAANKSLSGANLQRNTEIAKIKLN